MALDSTAGARSATSVRTRGQKRRAEAPLDVVGPSGREAADQGHKKEALSISMLLYVKWFSPSGKSKVTKLQLKRIQSVDLLQGIPKALMDRAFPAGSQPDYLTNTEDFYKFTPTDEFLSLPGHICRTEFRLVARYNNGWEYPVLYRELGAHRDPHRKMLVTVVEFESTALMVGHLGVRVSLIAYPVISIKKNFLDDIDKQLRTNLDFKGIA